MHGAEQLESRNLEQNPPNSRIRPPVKGSRISGRMQRENPSVGAHDEKKSKAVGEIHPSIGRSASEVARAYPDEYGARWTASRWSRSCRGGLEWDQRFEARDRRHRPHAVTFFPSSTRDHP